MGKKTKQVSVRDLESSSCVKTREVAGRTRLPKERKNCFPFRRYLGKQQLLEYYKN